MIREILTQIIGIAAVRIEIVVFKFLPPQQLVLPEVLILDNNK